MKKIVMLLSIIWQLPQDIIGSVIYLLTKPKKFKSTDEIVYYKVNKLLPENSGISLGHFIFINQRGYVSDNVVRHEHGHQIQSKIFGWLYLIVVGIPSLIRCVYYIKTNKSYEWYHSGYPEKWADKLGKVVE